MKAFLGISIVAIMILILVLYKAKKGKTEGLVIAHNVKCRENDPWPASAYDPKVYE